MSILNWQVNSFSGFASFFIAITHNSPVSFKLIHFLLCIKGPNERIQFWDFRVLWWKFVKFIMSFSKPQFSFSLNFSSHSTVVKYNSSVIFQLKHYILWSKDAQWSVNFWDFRVLESKFVRFLCQFSTRLKIFHYFLVSLHINAIKVQIF